MNELLQLKYKLDDFVSDIEVQLEDNRVIPFIEILKGLSLAVDKEIEKGDILCIVGYMN